MVIEDTALAKRQSENNPVKVAMFGADFMRRGIVLHCSRSTPLKEVVNTYPLDVLTSIMN